MYGLRQKRKILRAGQLSAFQEKPGLVTHVVP
jgi:hypothetical protein